VIERFAEIEISYFRRRSSGFGTNGSRWSITRNVAARGRTKGKSHGQAESD